MANLAGDSSVANVAAVSGRNTEAGRGLEGFSDKGQAVYGESVNQVGVIGISENFVGVWGESKSPGHPGIFGKSNNWQGIHGESVNQVGVIGISENFVGVWGESKSPGHPGIFGKSNNWQGIHGESVNQVGVIGISENFVGVWGESKSPGHPGIFGKSNNWQGIHGESVNQVGVIGISENFVGVWAETKTVNHPAFIAKGVSKAAVFDGDVEVTGDIRLTNADCAEDFDIICIEQVEPGTVMVIDSEGALRPSDQAYDKRVAGVISGAGGYKPGLILDKQESSNNRMPIALMGKVYCKVDAGYGAIEVGDLLTTSSTPGHAMRTDDPLKAFGAVIGKALRSLEEGQGLIPILIALQ